jgi:hypothetical protein
VRIEDSSDRVARTCGTRYGGQRSPTVLVVRERVAPHLLTCYDRTRGGFDSSRITSTRYAIFVAVPLILLGGGRG